MEATYALVALAVAGLVVQQWRLYRRARVARIVARRLRPYRRR
jgi:hypothetical protein